MYQTAAGVYPQQYGKNVQYPLVSGPYVQASNLQQQQLFYNANMGQYGAQRANKNQMLPTVNNGQKAPRGAAPAYQKGNGYQLKVGGVVVGSWANGSRNVQFSRMNRPGMVSTSSSTSNNHTTS